MYKKKLDTAEAVASADGTARVRSAKKYFTTAKIAYLAMFVAINVVIGAFSPRLGSLKITLTYTLCFLAGNFYGAVAGAIVGGVGDLLGCLIGGYAPNPIILLSSVLIGAIPGLVRYIKIKKLGRFLPYLQIIISYIFVFVVCTLFVNTYGLYVLGMAKGNTFWAYMAIRAATQSPIVAINLGLTFAVYPIFKMIADKSTPQLRTEIPEETKENDETVTPKES